MLGLINRFVVPLQQALRIGETALFLRRRGSRQEEDLRFDLARIHRLRLWPESWLSIPERCRLALVEITYHPPVELLQGLALHSRVRAARRWILYKEQVAVDCAIQHGIAGRQVRMVADNLGNPAIAAIAVFLIGRITIPGLQQTPHIGRSIRPPAQLLPGRIDVLLQRLLGEDIARCISLLAPRRRPGGLLGKWGRIIWKGQRGCRSVGSDNGRPSLSRW